MNENSIIQKIKSEQNDFYSNDDIYEITSWGADLSFRELVQRYDDEELVKPEMQRKYVWDKTEASRFIDSLLLGLPVPSIFLSKQKNEKMLIVDGYQRIMTVYDYINGIFSGDGKVFKLTRSNKINPKWSGKAFNELADEEQRRIKNTTIHAIIFVQSEPANDNTGMYQVFERINTSGRTLFPQEIRNCVYHGTFNKLLENLNKEKNWRRLYGLESTDSRMRDMEFILRFLALLEKDFRDEELTAISLKKFLNEFMKTNQDIDDIILEEFSNTFKITTKKILEVYGESAFQNISPTNPDKLVKKFNPTIFDSIMIATALVQKNNLEFPNNCGEERRLKLLKNEEYQAAISIRTTNIDQINSRFKLALETLYDINYEQL